jgi:hypothetical protein
VSIKTIAVVALAVLALAGCGGPEPKQDKAEAERLGRDTDETVFDDMIQTQDKARGVEDLTLGRKGDLDRALESSEGEGKGEQE